MPHREFHRHAGAQSSKVWGNSVSGRAKFRSLMSHKACLMARRGIEAGVIEKVVVLECGVEARCGSNARD